MAANFLVIQFARLGDLLQSKRLILSLAREGQVYLLVDTSLQAFARQIYPFAYVLAAKAHGQSNLAELFALNLRVFQELKRIDFAAVYNLNFSPLNYVCAQLFPGEIVKGYTHLNRQELKSSWTRKAFEWIKKRKLAPLNLIDFWSYLKEKGEICPPEEVNPLITQNKGEGVGIVLAGRNQRRSLSPYSLAQLIEVLLKQKKQKFYLLGTRAEQPLARELKKYLSPREKEFLIDLTGKTSLLDLLDLLPGLELVISPDTGLLHLCCHLGVQTWSFFLSSAWVFETGPYGQGHKVVQSFHSCAPCIENKKCLFQQKCHSDFTPKLFYLLSQEKVEPMPHLGLGSSYFDELGVNYRFSYGPLWLEEREQARFSLLAYLQGKDINWPYPDFLFAEREWILA
ncbi:MAG: ADP-heptose:LPS heptosyltransferase [Desulfonauticus sp. 38_4375]|nr:MAG: ADP-heptose:LPS heptosyltransferase [Desulfonauticus sp. 38_4375]